MGAAMHAAVHAAVAPWDIGAQQQESMDSAKAPHQAQAARKVLARCAVQCNDRCACARACMHYASLGALARGSTRTCVCCVYMFMCAHQHMQGAARDSACASSGLHPAESFLWQHLRPVSLVICKAVVIGQTRDG